MTIRIRILATPVAVLALLVPAVSAHADPAPLFISVDAERAFVYPAVDGYYDDIDISGHVLTGVGDPVRIRATVVVMTGTRVVKTWPLSQTGNFSFTWDGKVNGAVVSGSYYAGVTVDNGGILQGLVDPFVVYKQKITALTWTKTVNAASYGGCSDDKIVPIDEWLSYSDKICPRPFSGSNITLDARKSVGPVYFGAAYIPTPAAVRASLRPVVATVTAKVAQSGSGVNVMWIQPDGTGGVPVTRSFTKSGTYSVTQTVQIDQMQDIYWNVQVNHGHSLKLTTYTTKVTYYALR